MIESIITAFIYVLTVVGFFGVMLMPFYLIFAFCRAVWCDYFRSPNK